MIPITWTVTFSSDEGSVMFTMDVVLTPHLHFYVLVPNKEEFIRKITRKNLLTNDIVDGEFSASIMDHTLKIAFPAIFVEREQTASTKMYIYEILVEDPALTMVLRQYVK